MYMNAYESEDLDSGLCKLFPEEYRLIIVWLLFTHWDLYAHSNTNA